MESSRIIEGIKLDSFLTPDDLVLSILYKLNRLGLNIQASVYLKNGDGKLTTVNNLRNPKDRGNKISKLPIDYNENQEVKRYIESSRKDLTYIESIGLYVVGLNYVDKIGKEYFYYFFISGDNLKLENDKSLELTRNVLSNYISSLIGINTSKLGLLNSNALDYYEKSKDFSVVFFDVHKFKQCNDLGGYDFGDKVLLEVGKKLAEISRHNHDLVIHLSGDEFIVLVNGASTEEFLERVKQEFSSFILKDKNGREYNISLNIGKFDNKNNDTTLKIALERVKDDYIESKSKDGTAYRLGHSMFTDTAVFPEAIQELLKLILESTSSSKSGLWMYDPFNARGQLKIHQIKKALDDAFNNTIERHLEGQLFGASIVYDAGRRDGEDAFDPIAGLRLGERH